MSGARSGLAVLPVLVAAIGLGCGGTRSGEIDDGGAPALAHSHLIRGQATYGHEVRALRPCGSEDALWVFDESELLWPIVRELVGSETPIGDVFTVMEAEEVPAATEGFGSAYSGALRVTRVLYVGAEGPRCDYDWAFGYRALGNEPFWSVTATSTELRVTRLGEPDLLFPRVTRSRLGTGKLGYLGRDGSESAEAELVINLLRPCRDSMSGAYFAFSAELRIGGEVLTGCALRGDE